MVRRALRQNPSRRQVAVGWQVPPPIGGWNARDALAAMPPQDAVVLDNWVPRSGYCELRRGYIQQVTGFASAVETLLPYRGGAAGADKLFAASGGKLYDVTTAGGLGAAVLSGLTSNRWNYISFSNAAGAWTVACNGADAPIGYNAGAWAALPALSGTSGPYVLAPANLFNVFSHAGRLYFFEKNSLRVWNPAAGAVGGVCTLLDLSSVFNKAGRLVCGAAWSYEMGNVATEFAVFMTDQGQVAVYQGIDPTNVSTWTLVGVYDLAPPLGPRALAKFGGDLAIVTTDGIIPLSKALTMDRSQLDAAALTNKIGPAFSAAAKAYAANYGWQGLLYPGTATSNLTTSVGGSLAIFNVPISTLGTSIQFVLNLLTGAWARFTNINAFCWELVNGGVYFGASNGVYQWDQGASDNGAAIIGDVLGAYSAHGQSGRQKDYKAIRPLLNASPLAQPALTVCVDFKETTPVAVQTVIGIGSTAAVIRYDWTGAQGFGMVGAPRMQINQLADPSIPQFAVDGIGDLLVVDGTGGVLLTQNGLPFDVPCQLMGFDLLYEPGTPIG